MLVMRLHGMAEALRAQEQDANMQELSFLERLGCSSISNGTGGRTRLWVGD
jgi:hypothetical protein